jgi:MFS family permease
MAALASFEPAVEEPVPAGQLASIRRRTTWLLFGSQIFGSGATTASLTVATILASTILGGSTWAGLPNSVRTLGAALVSVPLSAYMVRAGRRKGLVLGYAVGVFGAGMSAASAVLMNYPLLLVGSAVFGAGYTANLLSRYAAADVSVASQRGKTISFVVWGGTVGAVIGPSIIGPAGEWAEKFGLPAIAGGFIVGVVTFGIASVMIFALLRPDPLQVSRLLAAQDPAMRETAPARSNSELLRLPGVQVGLIALMTSHMVMIGIMSMTPVYMHDHGHSLQIVGLVISAHVVGMYVFSPVTGWLADRIGRPSVIMLSALTFISAALLNSLTPPDQGALIGLGMFLIGLGWNLGFVAGSALLTDSVTFTERPRVQGVADMCMGVAAAVGSLASGPILETHGYPILNFWVVGLVVFPLAAIWLRQVRPQPIPIRS